MAFFMAHKAETFAALFAISELLDAIPQLQASSIWKLLFGLIKNLAGK